MEAVLIAFRSHGWFAQLMFPWSDKHIYPKAFVWYPFRLHIYPRYLSVSSSVSICHWWKSLKYYENFNHNYPVSAVTSNMNIDITWNQSKSNPTKPNKTMSFLVLYFTITSVWLSLFQTHPPFFLFLSPNPQNPTTFPGKRRISLPTFQSFSWVFNTNKSMKVVFPWCIAPKKLMLPQAEETSSTKGKAVTSS